MKLYPITIQHIKCLNKNYIFKAAFFNEDIGDGYGIKRFITTAGEVSVYDLFTNGTPPEWNDIELYYDNERKQREERTGLQIDDAWRYFADKSQAGKIWFIGYVPVYGRCGETDTKLLSETVSTEHLDAPHQDITFIKWMNLTANVKQQLIKAFFDAPVNCHEIIANHLLHGAVIDE